MLTLEDLEALKANPALTSAQLPSGSAAAHKWLSELMGKPVEVSLDCDEPFLLQAVECCCVNLNCEVSFWDPYEEGYDGGPGDLSGSWHTRGEISTGQYRGTVVAEQVRDVLGAIVVALTAYAHYGDDELYGQFQELADATWVPPLTREQRDQRTSEKITGEFSKLSPEAKKALLADLAKTTTS